MSKTTGTTMKDSEPPICTECGAKMKFMYGCGWDYDRWVCMELVGPMTLCAAEIELETTTTPESMKGSV